MKFNHLKKLNLLLINYLQYHFFMDFAQYTEGAETILVMLS